MASNSYGAGGWGSDDDVEMAAPPVMVQRPRGRADEGRGGGGESSRGGGGQSSSRSYPSSRGEPSSLSSRPRDVQQSGPPRDGGFDRSRIGMEQHRQQHQNRPFQRRPSPPPPLPSSSSSHLPSSSSQRRRSRSPPRATSTPSSEVRQGNHHQPHRHKSSARRRRERSSSPLDDGSPPLPSNPPSKPSSNAVASSSTYHPKDTSPSPRTLSRTTSSSSNPNHSHAQRVTASPFSISSQTVSPPSVTRYSPTFHCEVDTTPVPQPHRSAASAARPLPSSNGVASSSRLRPPPSSKPATWPSAAAPTQKKKLVSDFSDDEEEDEAPPRKAYDEFADEVDEIDETESEGEVVDLRVKQGRMDVEEEMEDSGPDFNSDDDEVQEIKPTPRLAPAPAPFKPAPPPPRTRRSPPPPPPQQRARVGSSSSSSTSIPPNLHSKSPDANDIKAATASTSFNLSNNFQSHRPEFAPPPVSQAHKQNPFSRAQNHAQYRDPHNSPVLPKHWIAQPRPPRESFGGPRNASQLAAILPGGRGGGQQQQFAQPMGMQQWGGGMMPPGAVVPLQQHQPFLPQQQPFFPPPTLGNRTPSYGPQGNRTPRAAVFGAHQIQWFEEDANGNVVSFNGGGGSMSPDQGSGGGSVRSVNGGGGGSMSPPQGGGGGANPYINAPQVQRRRSSSSEVKLQYRSLDSYPRLTPAKESEYKERKERCVELLKKVPGPDGRRALKVEEVETVSWYLSKVNLGLLNKVDLDEDPYFTCENSATFFKALMSRSEYDGFKAARKELAFLISLQTDRSQIALGMRTSQIAQVKSLLEEIKPRLDLLEDLISLRHPIFHTPPPITKGTLLSDEWEKALVRAQKKDAEARATHKLGRDKEKAEKEKGKGKERATE